MWRVLLHPRVHRFLEKQDPTLRNRLEDGLRKLKSDPYRFLETLEGRGAYKFRIGEYRAIVDLDPDRRVVKVQVLGHRSSVYKR